MPSIAPLNERIERYERMVALRNSTEPPMPYEEVGARLVPKLSKERVRQILEKGRPRRAGRPDRPDKREVLRRKLAFWERRLEAANEAGREDARVEAERWIADLTSRLAQLP